MGEVFRGEGGGSPKVIWLWALLGSLVIHFILMAAAFSWKAPLPPKTVKVVPVEPITLTKIRPGPSGGGGGEPAPAPVAQPAHPPKPAAPPKVIAKPKPKPIVPRPEKKPEPLEMAEPPVPPPPALTLPKPAPKPAPPARPIESARPAASASGAVGLGCTSSTGTGSGGSGGGSGRGTGSGSGVGQGPGAGAGSLLQGYLREVRRLLERHKEYPSMAQRQDMQGMAVLQFTIAADGRIEATSLCRSSGHGLLDKAAQETVRRVGRFPPLPASLGRERLTVEIPLSFRLTEN
ncbi:MAG: energy transducer TonB [Desulfobaccales bacterium]